MAGLLGKIKSRSGFLKTSTSTTTESRRCYPAMKASNERCLAFLPTVKPWTKGSTTLPGGNPTTVDIGVSRVFLTNFLQGHFDRAASGAYELKSDGRVDSLVPRVRDSQESGNGGLRWIGSWAFEVRGWVLGPGTEQSQRPMLLDRAGLARPGRVWPSVCSPCCFCFLQYRSRWPGGKRIINLRRRPDRQHPSAGERSRAGGGRSHAKWVDQGNQGIQQRRVCRRREAGHFLQHISAMGPGRESILQDSRAGNRPAQLQR